MSYFYIASPYTHQNTVVQYKRYCAVRDFTAWLAKEYKMWGFSPITHSHDMAMANGLPTTFEWWDEWNKTLIVPSDGLVVFQIEGWDKSRGIISEVNFAKALNKPIYYSQKMWGDLYDHSI